MWNLHRYLLVGFLVSSMIVSPALAGGWCCEPAYYSVWVEACPVVECCQPVECCESTVVYEPQVSCCGESDQSTESAPTEMSKPATPGPVPTEAPAQEDLVPPVASEDDSGSILDQPTEAVTEEPATTPPQVAVPDPTPVEESPVEVVAEPESEVDSLFDAPAETTPEPMPEEQPAESNVADLFDEPATTVEEPSESIVPESFDEQPTEDPAEGLFPPSSEEEAPAEEAPAEEAPAETQQEGSDESDSSEAPSLDDLFGDFHPEPVLNQPGGLASHDVRQWTDNTSQYRCQARLLQVTSQKVLLMKDNGKRIAVSFSRLSDKDLGFVKRQATAHRDLLARKAAQNKLASR